MGDLEDYEDVNPGSADYMDYSNKKGNKDQYGCEKFRKGQGNKERIEKRKCRSLKKCKSMQGMTAEIHPSIHQSIQNRQTKTYRTRRIRKDLPRWQMYRSCKANVFSKRWMIGLF